MPLLREVVLQAGAPPQDLLLLPAGATVPMFHRLTLLLRARALHDPHQHKPELLLLLLLPTWRRCTCLHCEDF
jgi:hypothetical protein